MEFHVPIQTEYLAGLPGGGELASIVAVVIVLASAGRWAHHRLAAARPAGAALDEIADDSDALWDEFEREREPAGV